MHLRYVSLCKVKQCNNTLIPHMQVYKVHVRVNADFVLSLLLEREQFDIARKYASIVHSTASQVTVKEVGGVN